MRTTSHQRISEEQGERTSKEVKLSGEAYPEYYLEKTKITVGVKTTSQGQFSGGGTLERRGGGNKRKLNILSGTLSKRMDGVSHDLAGRVQDTKPLRELDARKGLLKKGRKGLGKLKKIEEETTGKRKGNGFFCNLRKLGMTRRAR